MRFMKKISITVELKQHLICCKIYFLKKNISITIELKAVPVSVYYRSHRIVKPDVSAGMALSCWPSIKIGDKFIFNICRWLNEILGWYPRFCCLIQSVPLWVELKTGWGAGVVVLWVCQRHQNILLILLLARSDSDHEVNTSKMWLIRLKLTDTSKYVTNTSQHMSDKSIKRNWYV